MRIRRWLTPKTWHLTPGFSVLGILVAVTALWLSLQQPPARSAVTCIAFSPTGNLLAAADRDGNISVWRTDSFRVAAHIRLDYGRLNTLAFSPDGNSLAIAGESLELWSTASWKRITTLGERGAVYGTGRFSPDGRWLASVNASEQVELWDISTRRLVHTLCCVALYGDLAFSPNGESLAAAGHWPRLWDVRTGREILRLVGSREPTFGTITFRPDGRVIATGSQDGKTRLWDAITGRPLSSATTRHGYIETTAFHPKGSLLAYGTRDGAVWLWNTLTGFEQPVAAVATSNIAFSPDGHWLAFAGPRAVIHLWDVTTAHDGPVIPFPANY